MAAETFCNKKESGFCAALSFFSPGKEETFLYFVSRSVLATLALSNQIGHGSGHG